MSKFDMKYVFIYIKYLMKTKSSKISNFFCNNKQY